LLCLPFVLTLACTIPLEGEHRPELNITDTSPEPGQEEYLRNGSISLWFDVPLDPASVTSRSIELWSGEVRQGGEVSYDPTSRRLTFTPRGLFRRALAYDARLSPDISGLRQGAQLAEPYELSFVTGYETAELPPRRIVSHSGAVATLLDSRCGFSPCHGGEAPAASMRLDSPAGITSTAVGVTSDGWAGFPRIEPGSAAWSYLIYKINAEPTVRGTQMPPGRVLESEDSRLLQRWIQDGAEVDADSEAP